MIDSAVKGPIDLTIAGAPPDLGVPRAYGSGVWAFTVGLMGIVALLANTYYDDFAICGAAAVLGLLAFSRLFREQLLALPTGMWVVVLAMLAIAPRLAMLLTLPYQTGADFTVYHDAGVFMSRFWQLGPDDGLRCYYPPGQVFTLGVIYKLIGNNLPAAQMIQAAQMFNVLYAALTVVGLWYVARSMFGEFVGRVAGLLAVALPSTVFGVMLIGAETPEAFWLVLALCLYVSAIDRKQKLWAALLCGLTLGVGALIRPQYMLLPAAMGLHMFISWSGQRKKAILSVAVMGFGVAAMVLPWTIRNYFTAGGMVLLSSNSGQVIYSANCEDATGNYNQAAWDRLLAAIKQERAQDRSALEAQGLAASVSTGDVYLQRIGTRWALDWIRHNPGRFCRLAADKFKMFWEKDQEIAWWALEQPVIEHGPIITDLREHPRRLDDATAAGWGLNSWEVDQIAAGKMPSDTQFRLAAYDSIGVAPMTRQSWIGISVGYYIALVVAMMVGLLRFGRQLARNRAWMFFPIMAAYFTGIHMVFESQGKYHFMLVPLMCIFAALAVSPAEAVAPSEVASDRPPA